MLEKTPTVTLNLPKRYIKDIQLFLDAKIYPNRSEFVRKAINEYLLEEIENTLDLDPANLEQLLKKEDMHGKYKEKQV